MRSDRINKHHFAVRRLCVIRREDGSTLEWINSYPWCRKVRVAYVDRGGFGAIDYSWDGKETTVSGLPVYR